MKEQNQIKKDGFITINLPMSLATSVRVEAARQNKSRARFIREILIRELEKVNGLQIQRNSDRS